MIFLSAIALATLLVRLREHSAPTVLLLFEKAMARLYDEETVFAAGYSDQKWRRIRLGDSHGVVLERVGAPILRTVSPNGTVRLFYSEQGPRDTSYRKRIVVLDASGRVIQKKNYLYLD